MMFKVFTLICSLVFISSCAHSFMRGTVAMKIDDKTAHVCLGEKDVNIGDKLKFFHFECEKHANDWVEDDYMDCMSKKTGAGVVTRILNVHYSEVRTDGSFEFSEGTMVEKLKR